MYRITKVSIQLIYHDTIQRPSGGWWLGRDFLKNAIFFSSDTLSQFFVIIHIGKCFQGFLYTYG